MKNGYSSTTSEFYGRGLPREVAVFMTVRICQTGKKNHAAHVYRYGVPEHFYCPGRGLAAYEHRERTPAPHGAVRQ